MKKIQHLFSGGLKIASLVCLSSCASFEARIHDVTETASHAIADDNDDASSISNLAKDPAPYQFIRKQNADFLTFAELNSLLKNPKPDGALGAKLDRFFKTPIIDNSGYFNQGKKIKPFQKSEPLGDYVRLVSWNIEKSKNVPEVAEIMASHDYYLANPHPDVNLQKDAQKEACRQQEILAGADIYVLQEMDIGHCRSGYINAPELLAKRLGFNYAYGPAQLEIDPVYLGVEDVKFANGDVDHAACKLVHGDKKNYKGVFGSAVVSRFPIKRVRVFQLENQVYDWYTEEIKKPDFIERGRRQGSNKLFEFRPTREVKVGGRNVFLVDLHVPGIPHETLTIVNVHLEIKTTPKGREKQVKEMLGYIKDIKNPVVWVGDHNSSKFDVSSTSAGRLAKRQLLKPSNWFSAGLFAADVTGAGQVTKAVNYYKNYRNPVAWSLPVVLPNSTKGMFNILRKHRFSDGGAFDFRGDKERSLYGKDGILSNSNQRYKRGFTFTYSVPRPVAWLGRQRLDWVFVKSFLTAPRDSEGSYRLAPHFAETLTLMNLGFKHKLSDHHPIKVDLPINEPNILMSGMSQADAPDEPLNRLHKERNLREWEY